MAYMNQERKAALAAELKKVMPQGWKYSLAVRNHSTIVLTITDAPFNILGGLGREAASGHATINTHWIRECFADECLADVFEKIAAALNVGNHDRSDIMTDLFDVGWYVDIQVGRWDKPFKFVAPAISARGVA